MSKEKKAVQDEAVPRTRQGRAYMECFHIKDIDGAPGRSVWTRVGWGFQNRDGSWNLELNAAPIDGRLHMRPPRPRDDRSPAGEPSRAAA